MKKTIASLALWFFGIYGVCWGASPPKQAFGSYAISVLAFDKPIQETLVIDRYTSDGMLVGTLTRYGSTVAGWANSNFFCVSEVLATPPLLSICLDYKARATNKADVTAMFAVDSEGNPVSNGSAFSNLSGNVFPAKVKKSKLTSAARAMERPILEPGSALENGGGQRGEGSLKAAILDGIRSTYR